jgi:outer membrane protein TolC
MRNFVKASGLSAILLLTSLSFLPSQEKIAEKRTFSLQDCIAGALANNLSLSIEAFNPDIQDAAVAAAREQFLPQFGVSYSKQNMTSLGVWGLQGTSYPFRMSDYSFSLTQRVVTGTTASLAVGNSSSSTGQKYSVINPSYNGSVVLTLTQPLLKGFGPKVNRATTYQAERQKEVATAALKARVLQTLFDTEQAYWNLYNDLENIKVQQASLEQSREVLKRAKEGERIGNQSAIDVLNAETAAAGWEDALVSARLRADQSESVLRKLLNLPPVAPDSIERLSLSDNPAAERIEITYDQALASALVHRPEIIQAEKQIAIDVSQVGYWTNQLLPQLDLTLRGWSQGQSGIKYIYENGDPINGQLIDTIVGSRWEAFKQALKGTYTSWSADVSLTVPLADVFSRANLTQAKLRKEQSLADLEAQKQTVAFDVAETLKQLRNAELRIRSSAAARALQEKRLAAELQRYQLGLADSRWLFDYQRQLAAARTSEVQAVIDYRIAAARLERVMGTTLERKGLKFRDYEF